MSTEFQIELRKSNGNLHVRLKGYFDGNSACQLAERIHSGYDGSGLVFIDTHSLCDLCEFGCSTFRSVLDRKKVPADSLVFKGKKGFEIAPDGSRVIIACADKQGGCKGDCANCPCCGRNKKREKEM